jgi:hypothetical protein
MRLGLELRVGPNAVDKIERFLTDTPNSVFPGLIIQLVGFT